MRERRRWRLRRSTDRENAQKVNDASDASVSAEQFWRDNPSGKRPGFWRRHFGATRR
jgi:hypothetical protein